MRNEEADSALALADAIRPLLAEAGVARGRLLQREELPISDPWEPGVAELNLLLRPFLERLGLDHLDVYVELWSGDVKLRGLPDDDKERPPHRPSLWFDSIVEGLCVFAAEEEAAQEIRRAVPDAAHAAALALFTARSLELPFPERALETGTVTAALAGCGPLLLPDPPGLSASAVLAVLASEVRVGALELAELELSLAPQLHPLLYEHLTDA